MLIIDAGRCCISANGEAKYVSVFLSNYYFIFPFKSCGRVTSIGIPFQEFQFMYICQEIELINIAIYHIQNFPVNWERLSGGVFIS